MAHAARQLRPAAAGARAAESSKVRRSTAPTLGGRGLRAYSPKVLGRIGEAPAPSGEFRRARAGGRLQGMKTNLAVALLIGGYLAFAALEEGPIQFWLVALAPLLLLGVGFVLHVGDVHETGR